MGEPVMPLIAKAPVPRQVKTERAHQVASGWPAPLV